MLNFAIDFGNWLLIIRRIKDDFASVLKLLKSVSSNSFSLFQILDSHLLCLPHSDFNTFCNLLGYAGLFLILGTGAHGVGREGGIKVPATSLLL